MIDPSPYPLRRPELAPALGRGERKIVQLMTASGGARTLAPGATLVKAEAGDDFVYRVRQGWVGRLRTLPDGRSQYSLVYLPGDMLAVNSMFVTRQADDLQALTPCVIDQVEQRRLRRAFEEDPEIAARCAWQLVEDERRLHNWIIGLGRGRADERLALMVLDLLGRLKLSGTLAPDALAFELPMTQEQMGNHLGLSTVHVNRVLKIFREAGLVAIRGRRLTIGDLGGLARVAFSLLDTFERDSPAFAGGLA